MAQFWQKAQHGEIDPPVAAFSYGGGPCPCGARGPAPGREGGLGDRTGGYIYLNEHRFLHQKCAAAFYAHTCARAARKETLTRCNDVYDLHWMCL
jgi:hypothetical protein